MAELEIRPTISTDLARLSALDHSIETDYVWQLDLHREPAQVEVALREVRLPRTVRVEHPRTAKELPDTWHLRPMLSAMLGLEAVAYIRFTDVIVPSAVWVTDVVVGRPLRRQGLGRKLVAAAEAWGVNRGLRRVIVEVQSKNQPAIRMFLKMGYEFCGYNDQYYATRDVALFFARSL
jgi:ribosomal protein S18 acetylase RimI-like enzyme